MERLKLEKRPLFRMFIIQFAEILGLEFGLLICSYYIEFSFWTFQLVLLPIFFVLLLISKYNKSVTLIEIDIDNKLFIFNQNYLMLASKYYEMAFDEIHITIKWKWLFTRFMQVIEINQNEKTVVVIPLAGSIWKKDELNFFLSSVDELKKKNMIKVDLGSYTPLSHPRL
jgi:hypothetical protein